MFEVKLFRLHAVFIFAGNSLLQKNYFCFSFILWLKKLFYPSLYFLLIETIIGTNVARY